MKVVVNILLLVFTLTLYVGAQTLTNKVVPVITDSTTSIKNPAFSRDTLKTNGKVDSVSKHDPRIATRRSALIPGWGQAYNKEYWKIPFVYGVLSIPAGFFIYNQTWYKRTKRAYEIKFAKDTSSFPKIHPKLMDIGAESLRSYRNEFRRTKDYAILYFLAAWGLNVADATVFAHLKDFDVSDDLSIKIKPGYSPFANTSGISLVMAFKDTPKNFVQKSR